MPAGNDRFERLMPVLLPACIVIVGCGASLLPHHAIRLLVEFFVTWLCVSVTVGVLAGHCILTEGETL